MPIHRRSSFQASQLQTIVGHINFSYKSLGRCPVRALFSNFALLIKFIYWLFQILFLIIIIIFSTAFVGEIKISGFKSQTHLFIIVIIISCLLSIVYWFASMYKRKRNVRSTVIVSVDLANTRFLNTDPAWNRFALSFPFSFRLYFQILVRIHSHCTDICLKFRLINFLPHLFISLSPEKERKSMQKESNDEQLKARKLWNLCPKRTRILQPASNAFVQRSLLSSSLNCPYFSPFPSFSPLFESLFWFSSLFLFILCQFLLFCSVLARPWTKIIYKKRKREIKKTKEISQRSQSNIALLPQLNVAPTAPAEQIAKYCFVQSYQMKYLLIDT